MVSTISLSFSQQLKLPIHPMTHLIHIEGAGGQMLHYLGYVIATVRLPEVEQKVNAMFLVLPNIGYNCTTPLLIGTNILKHLCSSDTVACEYPWPSVFKCMNAQVRDLNVSTKTTGSSSQSIRW